MARTRERVRATVLELLAADGVAGLTVEAVAEHSGVAKSTIYRHWTDRQDLVADTLRHHRSGPGTTRDGRGERALVVDLVTHLAEAMADPAQSAVVPALVEAAERDEAVAESFHADNDDRREALVQLVAAGVEAGTFRDVDPTLAALALAGAVVYRRLMTATPLATADVARLVDTVLGPGDD
ncbi:TetR/AcrR family transcriptional regulator [Salsipaludibacter albus]|uniref:TetR/AcrR family transcriptional regulator n=1 Tax=Salsipaludibacter albus TaxID=2849650 RepID=UPI001EE3CF73|nr:TetR/AcrR family transcriptional regulator [Salsipaludibacter albus]